MKKNKRQSSTKKTLLRLFDYISSFKILLFIAVISTILSTIFMLVAPKVMGLATTSIHQSVIKGISIDMSYIGYVCVVLLVLYGVSALFEFVQGRVLVKLTQGIIYQMRRDVSEKVDKIPLSFFDKHQIGDLLSRMTNDISNVAVTLRQAINQLLSAIVQVVGIVIMMLLISPSLTVVSLVVIPVSFLAVSQITKKSQVYFRRQWSELGDLNGHIEEMFSGDLVVKSFNYQDRSVERFDVINEKLYDSTRRAEFLSGMVMPVMNFVSNIGYVFVAALGGMKVITGTIDLGDVQAFIQYSKQFNRPIAQTAEILNVIQSTVAASERVFEFLDAEEEVEDVKHAIPLNSSKGKIDFENVKFGYDADKLVIKDLSLDVPVGSTIAIVGPTGAGKTTLVNLLMRFYDVSSGEIKLDRENIKNYKRSDLRQRYGMVLQDTWLFKGTIAENIGYGKEDATREEIVMAAKAAYCDGFIRTLPDGYDTMLNEDATNISQGQKQLLTIARAILTNPDMMILDEATSSVDTRTEKLIQKAMDKVMQGRTSFVIAHRLSTIVNADMVLVMVEGDIVEKGSHNELMALNGFYTQLYNSQFEE
ncbi:MAG: ABC transporter ATP-binding protein [Tissierellia bacterium]|nr:ABC transporter ATP-binding protein [Tissierellia bacterium]